MARKPSRRGSRPDLDTEINLLPVLNLMVGLVPPLLLMASFLHLAVIDSSLPKIDQEPPPDQDLPETIPLVLTIELYENYLKGTCTGGILRSEIKNFKRGESTCEEIRIEKKDDEYDWPEMSKAIVALKEKHPEDESVIVRPVDAVRYEEIIYAMDYTRVCHPDVEEELGKKCFKDDTTLKRLLFPNVNLAFAAQEATGLIQ